MKKLVILLAVILSAQVMIAQKMDRTNAYNYNKDGRYEKAVESIEKCVNHQSFLGMKPKDQAQAWLYRGMIYLNVYQNKELFAKYPDALEKAYESLQNCIKTDESYTKDNYADIYSRIALVADSYAQNGIDKFNEKSFDEAASSFRKAYEISLIASTPDTIALENTGLAYLRAKKYEEALANYAELKALGYNEVGLYQNMAACYNALDNDEMTMNTINEGLAAYPGDNELIIGKVNLYLKQGKGEEAIADLNKLQEMEPDNISVLFSLGNLYGDDKNDIFNADKAIEYYTHIIDLDSTYYDAYYNMAMVYVTLSNQKTAEANEITGTSKAEILKANGLLDESAEFLRKGLPYAQTAYKAQPSDDLKRFLKQIYGKLNMMKEIKELDEQ